MSATIDDLDNLREIFGTPGELAVACIEEKMDEYHRRFIEMSPLICMATSGEDGQPFVSPRGDGPGYVKVLDEHTDEVEREDTSSAGCDRRLYGNGLAQPEVEYRTISRTPV